MLEPATVGWGIAFKPAGSMKPAYPVSTSLNWLADLTNGNINKEKKNKTESGSKNIPIILTDIIASLVEITLPLIYVRTSRTDNKPSFLTFLATGCVVTTCCACKIPIIRATGMCSGSTGHKGSQ